jgi:hypothetical protein
MEPVSNERSQWFDRLHPELPDSHYDTHCRKTGGRYSWLPKPELKAGYLLVVTTCFCYNCAFLMTEPSLYLRYSN